MPTSYIKSLSKKYNIPVDNLENAWERAKKMIGDQYDSNEAKYGAIVKVFKNIINKDFDLNESTEFNIYDFLLVKKYK